MGGVGNRCLALLFNTLLVLLTYQLARAQSGSSIVNITECSVEHLTFTLLEQLDGNSQYYFIAACSDKGTCVDGEVQLGLATEPTVGSTFQVSMGPSCTLSEELSPNGNELCTLLISSINVIYDTTGSTTTVCTLPKPSSTIISSTSLPASGTKQHSSSSVKPSQNGTVAPASAFSTPVLVTIIAVPSLLLLMMLIVAIVSLLVWMRYSKIRSKHTLMENMDVLTEITSGNTDIKFKL